MIEFFEKLFWCKLLKKHDWVKRPKRWYYECSRCYKYQHIVTEDDLKDQY